MKKSVSPKISFIAIIVLALLVMVLSFTIFPPKAYGDSYDIGDTGPAGGIIFYVDGSYYLEAAPGRQGYLIWSDVVELLGTTGTAIGTGKANTAAIITQGATSGAAVVCDNYELNGYDDWFLPSRDELYEMYVNRALIGGFGVPWYWSSSEYSADRAMEISFNDGSLTYLLKSEPDYVRPIRAFTLGGPASKEKEPEVWVRDVDMTCWQVWINEENNFEFVFWWAYENNNWVQIYDMEGNLVWQVDFEKDKPHFEVDLPDGMYKVQTFHEAGKILQEFIIGKP